MRAERTTFSSALACRTGSPLWLQILEENSTKVSGARDRVGDAVTAHIGSWLALEPTLRLRSFGTEWRRHRGS